MTVGKKRRGWTCEIAGGGMTGLEDELYEGQALMTSRCLSRSW